MTDLDARVKRLEDWANKPSWLDEPATLDGESFVLSERLPFGTKIVLSLFGCAFAFAVVLIVVASVYYRITGHQL